MISRISLLKCKEGVSEEAFREGMMGDVHDTIARMPQLRKCEIDFVTDRQQRSHARVFLRSRGGRRCRDVP